MSITFRPWVGNAYSSGEHFGKRVLILGESHYQWDESVPIDSWTTLTIECIEEQITGQSSTAYWTNAASTFLGHTPALPEKPAFWHSVAFYNYIQASVGFGPRVRPQPKMWTDSEPAFIEVLEELQPHVMIVLGYALWENLPPLSGRAGPSIAESKQAETWWYPHAGGETLAFGTMHPTSGRFSASYWHPHVLRAIELA